MSSWPEIPDSVIAVYLGTSRLTQRMRAERPRTGVTLSMLSVLSHLQREGPMTAGRLAALRRLEPQTLTRTLGRLAEEGLVIRRQAEHDRRQQHIEITELGRSCLREDMRPRVLWLAKAMATLSPTEQGVLQLAASLMDGFARWDLPGERLDRANTDPEIPSLD